MILSAFVVVILLYLKIRELLFNRKVRGISRDLFMALKDDLVISGVGGISEQDMIKKYQAMPIKDVGIGQDE